MASTIDLMEEPPELPGVSASSWEAASLSDLYQSRRAWEEVRPLIPGGFPGRIWLVINHRVSSFPLCSISFISKARECPAINSDLDPQLNCSFQACNPCCTSPASSALPPKVSQLATSCSPILPPDHAFPCRHHPVSRVSCLSALACIVASWRPGPSAALTSPGQRSLHLVDLQLFRVRTPVSSTDVHFLHPHVKI
jgi:hypothetical protein